MFAFAFTNKTAWTLHGCHKHKDKLFNRVRVPRTSRDPCYLLIIFHPQGSIPVPLLPTCSSEGIKPPASLCTSVNFGIISKCLG